MDNKDLYIEDFEIDDIQEVEEIDETIGIKADPLVLECLKNTIIFHLKENPEDYDISFIKKSYDIIKTHDTPGIEWLDALMENDDFRNRFINRQHVRRCF